MHKHLPGCNFTQDQTAATLLVQYSNCVSAVAADHLSRRVPRCIIDQLREGETSAVVRRKPYSLIDTTTATVGVTENQRSA